MLIKDIYKRKIITGEIDASLTDISLIMSENDIGFLPIEDNGKIVGVITDRDIVTRGISKHKRKIKNLLTRDIISINSDSDIKIALDIMGKRQVKRLLVEENNEFIGIISISDIIKSDYNENVLNTLKNIYEEESNEDDTEVDSFYL